MAQNFEDIRLKTICPDCGGKEISLGYRTSEGDIFKNEPITFWAGGLMYATSEVMIICKNCGLVVKSYAKDPKKL